MNPNQQNIQPDYSFITTQQPIGQPKSSKKKLALIACLLLLLLITLGLALATKSKQPSKEVSTPLPNNNAGAFVLALSKQDYSSAYALLGKKISEKNSLDNFTSTTKLALQNIDLSSCRTASDNNTDTKSGVFAFYCLHQDKKSYIQLKIVLNSENGIDGVYVL